MDTSINQCLVPTQEPGIPAHYRKCHRLPPFAKLAFVVSRIHGAPARITLDQSSESCPSFCGCPILRRFCEGWVFFGVGVGVGVGVGFGFDLRFVFRFLLIFQSIRGAQIFFPVLIKPVAAPGPQLRVRHKLSLHRVHVHVIEFFRSAGGPPFGACAWFPQLTDLSANDTTRAGHSEV